MMMTPVAINPFCNLMKIAGKAWKNRAKQRYLFRDVKAFCKFLAFLNGNQQLRQGAPTGFVRTDLPMRVRRGNGV